MPEMPMLLLCGVPGEDAYRVVRVLGHDGTQVQVKDLRTGEVLTVYESWLQPVQDLETFQVIWQAVADRGYRAGYTSPGFAVRQVLKLVEELGELAEVVRWAMPAAVAESLRLAAHAARRYFDDSWGMHVEHWPSGEARQQALAEAEDLQVVLAVLFAELQHRGLAGAARKAMDDVRRGVRG